jgi:hypothetical protein
MAIRRFATSTFTYSAAVSYTGLRAKKAGKRPCFALQHAILARGGNAAIKDVTRRRAHGANRGVQDDAGGICKSGTRVLGPRGMRGAAIVRRTQSGIVPAYLSYYSGWHLRSPYSSSIRRFGTGDRWYTESTILVLIAGRGNRALFVVKRHRPRIALLIKLCPTGQSLHAQRDGTDSRHAPTVGNVSGRLACSSAPKLCVPIYAKVSSRIISARKT